MAQYESMPRGFVRASSHILLFFPSLDMDDARKRYAAAGKSMIEILNKYNPTSIGRTIVKRNPDTKEALPSYVVTAYFDEIGFENLKNAAGLVEKHVLDGSVTYQYMSEKPKTVLLVLAGS